MDSQRFADDMVARVERFCATLDERLPAYSYIPLTDDASRVKVMKNRHWNEIRAGEIFGSWLKSTPEQDVKAALAAATHEEFEHAILLEAALQAKGEDAFDYLPLPAQVAMFNAFESLTGTVERMAAFPLAGEGVANYMIKRSIEASTVPDWVTAPYRDIHADEESHGNYPAEVLAKYAKTPEQQDFVRRVIEMSLVLRRQYFDNVDRWVYEDKVW